MYHPKACFISFNQFQIELKCLRHLQLEDGPVMKPFFVSDNVPSEARFISFNQFQIELKCPRHLQLEDGPAMKPFLVGI